MSEFPHDATPAERLAILHRARTVALLGVSANPLRSSNFVATYLVRTPYLIRPVNPVYPEVLGIPTFPSLADLPEPPDIVDVFRRTDQLPAWSRRRSKPAPKWSGSSWGFAMRKPPLGPGKRG